MINTAITLTEMDYVRLNSLIEKRDDYFLSPYELEKLENEVDRAAVIDFPEIPTNLVTMNTRFRYLNTTENKFGEMTIVYPENANFLVDKISVVAPLGTAFLGLREDDEIDWTFPDGKKRTLRVLEILYQPEANGDLSL